MFRKEFFIFILFFLFGVGCVSRNTNLDTQKLQEVLKLTGNDLKWNGNVIKKQPNDRNYYGISYIIYGPSNGRVEDNTNDSLEIIEFKDSNIAKYSYGNDECFKGSGKPIKILGTDACCLDDKIKEMSETIMIRGKYIFRSYNYLRSDCMAKEYLIKFWNNYKNF